jgi:hypothetical protein
MLNNLYSKLLLTSTQILEGFTYDHPKSKSIVILGTNTQNSKKWFKLGPS